MESSLIKSNHKRIKRALRVRKGVRGSRVKPRLCVIKTNCHIHAQIIDDDSGVTLASVSTVSKEFRDTEHNRKNKASAHQLGVKLAELAKKSDIERVVFDRGAAKFHGVISALADGVREGGIQV